jgi:hypothetical protein
MDRVDMGEVENREGKAVSAQAEKVARFFKKYCKSEESLLALEKSGIVQEGGRDLIVHGKRTEEYIARFTERDAIDALYMKIKDHLGVDDPAPGSEVDYETEAL